MKKSKRAGKEPTTDLGRWMAEHGVTIHDMARRSRCHHYTVAKAMDDCVTQKDAATRLSEATEGAVSAASIMGLT